MTALHWLSAEDCGRAIASGELSPVRLAEHLIERIHRLDPELHAVLDIDERQVLADARAAHDEVRAGTVRGPLHGVPFGVKDVIDVAGVRTTCGSRLFEHCPPARDDAASVRNLRASGAIFMAKLTTFEFAFGGPNFDLPWPPARNPWNLEHHPGGSSSGAGAAVAAGLMPMAVGTDTGGSVRHPASACGIVGLKPTYDLVPLAGVFPVATPVDHVGSLTRTVRDSALMLSAMTGGSVACPPSEESSLHGLRIGYVRHFHVEDVDADPEIAAALDRAAQTLEGAGATIVDVRLPAIEDLSAVWHALVFGHSWSVHRDWLRETPEKYGDITRQRVIAGAFLPSDALVRAEALQKSMAAGIDAVFRDVDVLLCASLMDLPCRIDDPAALARTGARGAGARLPFNVSGHPALAMMAGLSVTGLPIAAQLVGRHFQEDVVFRVARALERSLGVDALNPPV